MLSKNPFTATRSIRFVVAAYTTTSTVSSSASLNDRVTSDESSLSTARARSAAVALRAVGKGMRRVLWLLVGAGACEWETYSVCG